ncbi:MAG: 1-acyl-sn-glycerol-3-phosphate acyltransferase [Truepera sp.]|nr:1-acyl-sn-glycerol-3-phosphate acyltransferase [Truepera sp.]
MVLGILTRLMQGRWFYGLAVVLFTIYAKLFHRFTALGIEKIPKSGGVIVASNHFSSLDPPMLGIAVPREIHYMAKKELFENPWLRLLLLGLRAYPVDRARSDISAIKASLRKLKARLAIGIFIQGTRNPGDAKALDGAAFIAQRAAVPVVPAAIWREGRRFFIRFGDAVWPQGLSREEASTLTQEIMARIRALLPATKEP